MRLLRPIAKEHGRRVVTVSHDQRIRDIADRVLWLEDGAFKDIVTMATDPVCGMAVERERAVSAVHGGKTYYFCSRGCRDEFVSDNGNGPRSWLRSASGFISRHTGLSGDGADDRVTAKTEN
ncbi:MAG: YHS domain-containing protein [Chloroflexi bacterium]|nr:YHS domain-containing protein [Chloroflexota bacterium]